MLTSGQIDTPGPVRLIREFDSFTRSSTYVVMPRRVMWLREPTRITLLCGRLPFGLIWSWKTSLKTPSRSPSMPSSALTTSMHISTLFAGINGQKLWSDSTTQTGKVDRMTCFSGHVTHNMDFGSKDIAMLSLSLRLW